MTKIKRFTYTNNGKVNEPCSDDAINDFMKDKNVIDVKISCCYWEEIVMVVYKENEDD